MALETWSNCSKWIYLSNVISKIVFYFKFDTSDLSTTIQGTQNTLATLLDRVSALERMSNFQRQQIDGMETTISELETTVSRQTAQLAVTQVLSNISLVRLSNIEKAHQGSLNV